VLSDDGSLLGIVTAEVLRVATSDPEFVQVSVSCKLRGPYPSFHSQRNILGRRSSPECGIAGLTADETLCLSHSPVEAAPRLESTAPSGLKRRR
jgi:hypothetical protein